MNHFWSDHAWVFALFGGMTIGLLAAAAGALIHVHRVNVLTDQAKEVADQAKRVSLHVSSILHDDHRPMKERLNDVESEVANLSRKVDALYKLLAKDERITEGR